MEPGRGLKAGSTLASPVVTQEQQQKLAASWLAAC